MGDGIYIPSLSVRDGMEIPSLSVKTSTESIAINIEIYSVSKPKAICKVSALQQWEMDNYQWKLVKTLVYIPLKTFFSLSSSLFLSRIRDSVVQ